MSREDELFLMAMANGFEYETSERVNDALTKCYLDIQYYLSSDESEDELNERLNDNVKGLDSDEIEYINRDINNTINRRNRKYR